VARNRIKPLPLNEQALLAQVGEQVVSDNVLPPAPHKTLAATPAAPASTRQPDGGAVKFTKDIECRK
jgi:hypothetical protein